nr:probable E3 ubiquitin-protein ligase TRIML2 [Vicugna pacos]
MSKRLPSQLEQKIPEDACCEKHLEPPQLFCGDDQMMLCDKYFQSQEHKTHTVYGLQETAENYRKLFQEILTTLKEKLEVAKSMLADEQERMVMMQVSACIPDLRSSLSIFKENKHLVENEKLLNGNQEMLLQRLNNLGRENVSKLKESEVRLSEHTCSLQKIIAELEKKCGQSASALLQNARCALERSESLLLQCLEPAQITDLNLCQITGMSKMLKVLQRPITLDHRTAHPCLVLSEDLRSVRLRNVQQDTPGHPERFDFSATVLGVESFTSGRHYWEVDVEKATQWQLGIYEGSAYRNDSRDKVLLMGTMMGTDYIFWAFPPLRRISLRERVHSVGVFLNYEYGQVSFYDVTKRSLIYNFSGLTFQGALRPIFSLCVPNGGMNSDSLSICLPHVSSCNGTVSPQSSLV